MLASLQHPSSAIDHARRCDTSSTRGSLKKKHAGEGFVCASEIEWAWKDGFAAYIRQGFTAQVKICPHALAELRTSETQSVGAGSGRHLFS